MSRLSFSPNKPVRVTDEREPYQPISSSSQQNESLPPPSSSKRQRYGLPTLNTKGEDDLMSSGELVAKRTEPSFDYLMVNNQY